MPSDGGKTTKVLQFAGFKNEDRLACSAGFLLTCSSAE
jgi:hypothetical protein